MNIVLVVLDEVPDTDLFPAIVVEFETLMLGLDLGLSTRQDWDRFKSILAIATIEAGDAEAGAAGYAKALAKWRTCRWYDGHE
jgi:hypothetical protein